MSGDGDLSDASPRELEGRAMTADELIDAWEAAWSGKDAAAFTPICSEEIHYEDPVAGEPLEGLEALCVHAQTPVGRFPRCAAGEAWSAPP